MKKIITLALALVLALGLAMPAMAFTSDTSADDSIPYSLKVYLVEYDDNDLFGLATLPESDRGYAKNEIVAAIIELDVPKNEDPEVDGYDSLNISGDNVTFAVTDNAAIGNNLVADIKTSNAPELAWKTDHADGFTYAITDASLAGEETFKWLVFAKVTDDEASITAKLVDGTPAGDFGTGNTGSFNVTLDGTTYGIAKAKSSGAAGTYTITWTDETVAHAIKIDVDEDYKSTGMTITIGSTVYPLGVNTKGELGYVKDAQVITGKDAEDVMDVYNDTVVDVFGLDYMLIGNYVRDSFFEDLTSGDTIVATVDIAPWTAYVTVPDNIVVDPPKTGDAASIMGFVMVALSGAGVVALRKRG